MKITAVLLFCSMFLSFSLNAGTLIFKDGRRLTDVTIVSISEGRVVVEKDNTKKTFGLSEIGSFYKTDMKAGDSVGDEKDIADYDISFSVKIPETGLKKSGKETETATCDITFNIIRKGDNKTANKVKWPYFYIYVLTHSSEEYGGRNIYCYYHPKTAKLKSKAYDKAAVMDILGNFDRPYYHFDQSTSWDINSGAGKKLKGMTGEREFSVELKDVKGRRILAYYIEVWGNTEIIDQKEWKATGVSVGARWWEKYSGNKIIN